MTKRQKKWNITRIVKLPYLGKERLDWKKGLVGFGWFSNTISNSDQGGSGAGWTGQKTNKQMRQWTNKWEKTKSTWYVVTMKTVNNAFLLSSGTAVVYPFLHDIAIFRIQLMNVTNTECKWGTNSNVFLQRKMQKHFNNNFFITDE